MFLHLQHLLYQWVRHYIKPSSIKSIKEQENLPFSVNIKYISSLELKTSEFSHVLRTRENSVFFNTLEAIYKRYSPNKSRYPLFII